MNPRQLGTTSIHVHPIGLGCMGMSEFYGPADDAASIRVLQLAVELGVTLFDSADIYGLDGHNERLLGQALAPVRSRVCLATKFGFVRTDEGLGRKVVGHPRYVRQACEASLERLGTDCIDLYYLHRLDPATPIEDTVGAMADLVRSGKIRAIGLCEVSATTLRKAAAVHPIAAVQSEFSLWSRDIETNGVLQACEELSITVVPFSPLGRAFLAGGVQTATLPSDDLRSTLPRFQPDNLAHNQALLQGLQRLAADKGCTASQLALGWLLARSPRIVPIPGTKRERFLRENLGAAEVALTPRDLRQLEALFPVGVARGERYGPGGMKMVNL